MTNDPTATNARPLKRRKIVGFQGEPPVIRDRLAEKDSRKGNIKQVKKGRPAMRRNSWNETNTGSKTDTFISGIARNTGCRVIRIRAEIVNA
jgi:hypothetical protein